jgi:hypothetical protein
MSKNKDFLALVHAIGDAARETMDLDVRLVLAADRETGAMHVGSADDDEMLCVLLEETAREYARAHARRRGPAAPARRCEGCRAGVRAGLRAEEEAVSEPPEGYTRCVEAMQRAAAAWVKRHPFAELRFHNFAADLAREAGKPGQKVAVIAALPDVIERWAANADTRAFLQALDDASGGEATFLQAKAIIDAALEASIARAQGQLPKEGSWLCPTCSALSDAFTNADGKAKAPGPGALMVCWQCGGFSVVNDAANGYEALSTQEFNALPKVARMQLRKLQSTVRQRLEREKARS